MKNKLLVLGAAALLYLGAVKVYDVLEKSEYGLLVTKSTVPCGVNVKSTNKKIIDDKEYQVKELYGGVKQLTTLTIGKIPNVGTVYISDDMQSSGDKLMISVLGDIDITLPMDSIQVGDIVYENNVISINVDCVIEYKYRSEIVYFDKYFSKDINYTDIYKNIINDIVTVDKYEDIVNRLAVSTEQTLESLIKHKTKVKIHIKNYYSSTEELSMNKTKI